MTLRRPGIIACLAVIMAACASTPTFRAGDVTVVDESGLVTAAEALQSATVEAPSAVAGDSLTQVVVSWPADTCIENWLVRLAGNALSLTIEAGTRLVNCAGSPTGHAIELTLNRVVDAGAIDISLAGAP